LHHIYSILEWIREAGKSRWTSLVRYESLMRPRIHAEMANTMVRITLMDGSTQEVPREEIKGFLPLPPLFRNPHLKADALAYHGGILVPVLGPIGETQGLEKIENRAWLLMMGEHAQVVRGLPAFDDDIKLEIVPVRAQPAPKLVAISATEPAVEIPTAVAIAEAFAEAAPHAPVAALTEEEEESNLMKELEEMFKAA
jgi:hypothetical protein